MKRHGFFIITIVIGTIIFQGVYVAKERKSQIKQQKITIKESLEAQKEVADYVNEMVEFPADHSQKALTHTILVALFQMISQRKTTVLRYLVTIKSLYYYMLGSLLGAAESIISFLRRKS